MQVIPVRTMAYGAWCCGCSSGLTLDSNKYIEVGSQLDKRFVSEVLPPDPLVLIYMSESGSQGFGEPVMTGQVFQLSWKSRMRDRYNKDPDPAFVWCLGKAKHMGNTHNTIALVTTLYKHDYPKRIGKHRPMSSNHLCSVQCLRVVVPNGLSCSVRMLFQCPSLRKYQRFWVSPWISRPEGYVSGVI